MDEPCTTRTGLERLADGRVSESASVGGLCGPLAVSAARASLTDLAEEALPVVGGICSRIHLGSVTAFSL